MAFASLLTLLDDITSALDDVAVMTKTAATKTAGVLGDDLALNAEQVMGAVAKRELPIVFKVALGSFVNKLILVPAALLIAAFAPWLMKPLLLLGGAYLCFEGFEKVLHVLAKRFGQTHDETASHADAAAPDVDEKAKIKGAIRTDFVLSAEIITIALGTVADVPLLDKALVLAAIAVMMTVGVYGLVALIVKLDDIGLWLLRQSRFWHPFGRMLVGLMPYLMRFLAIAGTAAMFVVGGGIVTHNAFPMIAHTGEHLLAAWPPVVAGALESVLLPALVGFISGALAWGVLTLGTRLWQKRPRKAP